MIRSWTASPRWHAALFALAAFACDGGVTETIVVIDGDARARERAQEIHVQVFDTEGERVLDRTRTLGPDAVTLPARVPLFPIGDDASRVFRVVAELRTNYGCVLGSGELSGGYDAGESIEVPLTIAHAAPDPCPEVYVDPDRGTDDPTACVSDATPCATFGYARDQYVSSGIASVITLAANTRYEALGLGDIQTGTPERWTVVRGGPGSPPPLVEAAPGGDNAFNIGMGAEYVLVTGLTLRGGRVGCFTANQPRNVVVDGNDLAECGGGVEELTGDHSGAVMLGNGLANVTVRGNRIDSIVRTDGEGDDLVSGVFCGPSGTDVVIEDNVITSSTVGIHARGARVVIAYNRICGSGWHAIRADASALEIAHNTVVGSAGYGLAYAGPGDATIRDNLMVDDALGHILSEGVAEATLATNLYFGTGEPVRGQAPSATALIGVDPLRLAPEDCETMALSDASPAIGAASDGSTIGAWQPD